MTTSLRRRRRRHRCAAAAAPVPSLDVLTKRS